jgi:hypothetical protein
MNKDMKPDTRGTHTNSLKNLKPIKKGEIRNTKGNPGKRTLPDLKSLIAEMVTDDDWRKLVAIIHKKAKTNPTWTNLLMDRAYGKPVAFIEATQTPIINVTHTVIEGTPNNIERIKRDEDPQRALSTSEIKTTLP